ncbi:glycosyltransferase family 2 protein [Nonlabens ulvanivorans]|uniref:glycosyltransferase family 2 protein n=1 Tax=Nonlabens ulvanivorans TaxID=906888 RepID=UPI0029437DDD|nr:glycosyltransferase family 2 protein [Nonlabens ulvanivorans]WOI23094.1 glycosyltransferase family 2 protein [Nonlabens ulvanivorans]
MRNQNTTYLVSIIIPVFNREALIVETLHSIKNQTYLNWECILVDDGSTDQTIEVIKSFIEKDQRFVLLKRPELEEKGANVCRNIGMAKSSGDYLVFFDSDDLMVSTYLEKQLHNIVNNNADFSVCKMDFFEKNDHYFTREKPCYHKELWENYVTRQLTILTGSVMWSKAFLSLHGMSFNIKLQAAQEWDFISRALLHSPVHAFADSLLYHSRMHEDSISYADHKLRIRESSYVLARKLYYSEFHEIFTDRLKLYFQKYFKDEFKKKQRFGWISEALDLYFYNLKYFYSSRFLIVGILSIFSFFFFKKGENLLKLLDFKKLQS